MAYEKQIWKDLPDETTPITTERLNHLEDGVFENDTQLSKILEALGLNNDTYDSTKTYAAGDMVIKNHAIYECTTTITTAEAWNSSHWKIVPIITN